MITPCITTRIWSKFNDLCRAYNNIAYNIHYIIIGGGKGRGGASAPKAPLVSTPMVIRIGGTSVFNILA